MRRRACLRLASGDKETASAGGARFKKAGCRKFGLHGPAPLRERAPTNLKRSGPCGPCLDSFSAFSSLRMFSMMTVCMFSSFGFQARSGTIWLTTCCASGRGDAHVRV
jgi:hypothetical protein